MTHFLITGGAGFVGSHLVSALLRDGHRVRVLDDLSSGTRNRIPPQAEFIRGDITDPPTVTRAFEGIECCYHLAAIASVERSNLEWLRCHQVNLTGTINIFHRARGVGPSRAIPVIFASSAAIYGDRENVRVDETCPPSPLSAYGADKAACELHARVAGAVHGVPTLGLRFFNLYGPHQDPQSPYSGVVTRFLTRLMRGDPVDIHGDGEQIRDFTYIEDAVTALRLAQAAATLEAPAFNVCSGVGVTVRDLAGMIAELCSTPLVIRWREPRPGDPRISSGDPALAASRLRFRAAVRLSDGLRLTRDSWSNGAGQECGHP